MCRSAPAPRWWNYADARRARFTASLCNALFESFFNSNPYATGALVVIADLLQ